MIKKEVTLDLSAHFFVGLALAFVTLHFSNNIYYAAAFFLASIFIDLDHLVDYFLYNKCKFNFLDFMDSNFLEGGKVYLFFHSWELVIAILLAACFIDSNLLTFISLGLSAHLVVDNVQRKNSFFYFLVYRFAVKFQVRRLLEGENI